jgi:hypothetical protein
MSQTLNAAIAVVGIDISKNSFHIVGHDERGAIVSRQKWSRGQVEARFANVPPCLIGMKACVGAHHLSRILRALGHDARLMPAKYVRPYSKGQRNDFRDAEAIAEAVQRPTKVRGNKTADRELSDLLDQLARSAIVLMLAHRRNGVANRADALEITVEPFALTGKALFRSKITLAEMRASGASIGAVDSKDVLWTVRDLFESDLVAARQRNDAMGHIRTFGNFYSIITSARARRDSGIASPSALAVLRFMTSINLVGCSTGISAGFAPRKILSTKSAAR